MEVVMTLQKWAYFFSIVFVAIIFVPAGAHLAELLNKIDLPKEQYFVVQNIYAGWALFGAPVFAALLSLLVLVISLRRERRPFAWALIAFLCVVATQVVFWIWTYPMNVATNNWTTIPENWEALRRQWEYAHAVNAVLTFVAIVALALSVLSWREGERVVHRHAVP
jgi:MFS family permease